MASRQNLEKSAENIDSIFAFKKNNLRTREWRIKTLRAIDRMLAEQEDLFVEALEKDLKKPYFECRKGDKK